jgi:hypothetical protein
MRRIRKLKVPERRGIFQKQAPIGVNLNQEFKSSNQCLMEDLNQLASRKGTPYLDASEKNHLPTSKTGISMASIWTKPALTFLLQYYLGQSVESNDFH